MQWHTTVGTEMGTWCDLVCNGSLEYRAEVEVHKLNGFLTDGATDVYTVR